MATEATPPAPACTVRRIWDEAGHNAFTDLLRYRNRWWCAFREGATHVSPDGALRILCSSDGVQWASAALLTSPGQDLRDPKLCITPQQTLMLVGAGVRHNGPGRRFRSYAWYSDDGLRWSKALAIADPGYWLWRASWHEGFCYGVAYRYHEPRQARLYRSGDGRRFESWVDVLHEEGFPNESALVFAPDGNACCLLRRDPGPGLLGTAPAPYRDWRWRELEQRIGGPQLLRLDDGRWVAAVRLYDEPVRTALCWLEPASARLTEFLALPSGGDSSYAGLAWHEQRLWVSYYSSHEGKTAIYLAEVELA